MTRSDPHGFRVLDPRAAGLPAEDTDTDDHLDDLVAMLSDRSRLDAVGSRP